MIRATRRAVALLALPALLSLSAAAGPLDDFFAFNAATKSASARFEQQVYDRSGKAMDKASGTFAFARPGKFRWAYDKPVKQLIVGDGAKLWIHDADLNQVTVKRIDQAMSATPAALLAGKDDITAVFTLTDGGSAGGMGWVVATPKKADTGFEQVRLGMRGRALVAMELTDSLGGTTKLQFLDLKPNPSLPPETFRFTPPKGADVIGEK